MNEITPPKTYPRVLCLFRSRENLEKVTARWKALGYTEAEALRIAVDRAAAQESFEKGKPLDEPPGECEARIMPESFGPDVKPGTWYTVRLEDPRVELERLVREGLANPPKFEPLPALGLFAYGRLPKIEFF